MGKLRIGLCEDNVYDMEQLVFILQESGIPVSLDCFETGEDLLEQFQPGAYDLIFMDIYMGGMLGVETVQKIRALDHEVAVAFTTTSTDHTLESYRLNVLKYIEKPVVKDAVVDLLKLVQAKKQSVPHATLLINGECVCVPFHQILYLEQKGHTIQVFLQGGNVLRTHAKLDQVQLPFAEQSFFRCHKSYLVNLAYVKSIDSDYSVFKMKEGANVYIRREGMKKAREAWENWLFHRARGDFQS